MNTLLTAAANDWETYCKHGMASALIVEGLLKVQKNDINTVSPGTFEMEPVKMEKQKPVKNNIFVSIYEHISKTMKASA